MKTRDSRKGNAMVEFSLAAIVFLVLSVGAVDFARMFSEATSMINAAAAGTQYATYTSIAVGDIADATTAAQAALSDTSGATVASGPTCYCGTTLMTNCQTDHCASNSNSYQDLNNMYVRTTIKKDFQTLIKYPWIPKVVPMETEVWMRVR